MAKVYTIYLSRILTKYKIETNWDHVIYQEENGAYYEYMQSENR